MLEVSLEDIDAGQMTRPRVGSSDIEQTMLANSGYAGRTVRNRAGDYQPTRNEAARSKEPFREDMLPKAAEDDTDE